METTTLETENGNETEQKIDIKELLNTINKQEMELQIEIRSLQDKTNVTAQQLKVTVEDNIKILDPSLVEIYNTIKKLTNDFTNANLTPETIKSLQEYLPMLSEKQQAYAIDIKSTESQLKELVTI